MDRHENNNRPWGDMYPELLAIILDNVFLLPDFIWFGSVCRNWNRAAVFQENQRRIYAQRRQPPMLFIPTPNAVRVGRLFSLAERRLYYQNLDFPFTERCCGTSHGWWCFPQRGGQSNIFLTLLNPFSQTRIDLPTIDQLPNIGYLALLFPERIFVKKVLLSCNPTQNPQGYVVAVIHRTEVSFLVAGRDRWTTLSTGFQHVNDACFHLGHLYLLVGRRSTRIISIDMMLIRQGNPIGPGAFRHYPNHQLPTSMFKFLLECGQDLLVVSGYLPRHGRRWFRIRRMTENGWVDVRNLGTYSLFIESVSSTSANVDRVSNCSVNSIYYIYQNPNPEPEELADDMGIWNLRTGQISRFYEPHDRRFRPCPVWLHAPLGAMGRR